MTKAFLDTNVLLYLISMDTLKAERSWSLLDGATISIQVLGEFAHSASRKHVW